MFDFAWSEIMLVGVVALIAIGPKDMPVAIRAITDTIKKLRRMAGEFQHHVDDMMRDANLQDVQSSINDLRQLNFKAQVQKAIDPDRTLARAFEDPFRENPVITPGFGRTPVSQTDLAVPPAPSAIAAPDFIPPGTRPPRPPGPLAPAFIPPESTAEPRDGF